MNEQQLDALPPVNLDSVNTQSESTNSGQAADNGSTELPGTSVAAPMSAPLLDPAAAVSIDDAQAAIPQIADDVDLIEKEWVEKAKQIVEQTKHDPYQQNEAMTKMKNDYLKKRYNRDIKVREE